MLLCFLSDAAMASLGLAVVRAYACCLSWQEAPFRPHLIGLGLEALVVRRGPLIEGRRFGPLGDPPIVRGGGDKKQRGKAPTDPASAASVS